VNESADEHIILAHGGGGELTKQLLSERILPKLGNDLLNPLTDGAILGVSTDKICMTTDAYVVQPLEFPGGDIGCLAVCGTVNDLAVMGTRPVALSLALVIEEGLSFAVLDRIVNSIAAAAKEANVLIATGDTKVIERRKGDGLTITTAGIGELADGPALDAARIRAGDAVMITGRIAEHGLAVMSAREHLSFETELLSDVAPLHELIQGMIASGADIKFLRDPTRGGLAGVLADLAEDSGLSIEVDEATIPISPVAHHTAEMLGLDPLTVANEGKCVAVMPGDDAEKVLDACRRHPLGEHAAIIGHFTEATPPLVELVTRAGGRRMVTRPYGEELPRIC